jgi:hypothetical protein
VVVHKKLESTCALTRLTGANHAASLLTCREEAMKLLSPSAPSELAPPMEPQSVPEGEAVPFHSSGVTCMFPSTLACALVTVLACAKPSLQFTHAAVISNKFLTERPVSNEPAGEGPGQDQAEAKELSPAAQQDAPAE